jgi:hypothetical protein
VALAFEVLFASLAWLTDFVVWHWLLGPPLPYPLLGLFFYFKKALVNVWQLSPLWLG